MRNLQPIYDNGCLVAVVVGGQAVIDDTLSDQQSRRAQAMCLYALELADDGGGDREYSDADAEAYARAALGVG
jgi:hypothetical protein